MKISNQIIPRIPIVGIKEGVEKEKEIQNRSSKLS